MNSRIIYWIRPVPQPGARKFLEYKSENWKSKLNLNNKVNYLRENVLITNSGYNKIHSNKSYNKIHSNKSYNKIHNHFIHAATPADTPSIDDNGEWFWRQRRLSAGKAPLSARRKNEMWNIEESSAGVEEERTCARA